MTRVVPRPWLFASLLFLCAICARAQEPASAQAPEPWRTLEGSRPKICLALGGGGARGIAHVGVLRALEAMRVPVDCVAGTSMGAVVGSLVAMGLSVEEIEEVTLTTDWEAMSTDRPPRQQMSFRRRQDDVSQLVDFEIGVGMQGLKLPRGVIQGQNLLVFLRNLGHDYALVKNFDRLPVPFRAVATDIETGETVIIGRGDLPQAVRASMSVPAVFSPAEVGGRMLVDGGLFANVPVDAARAMGADVIIAVDVGYPVVDRSRLNSALEIADQTVTLMMRAGTQAQLAKLGDRDVIIVPALGETSSAAFDDTIEIMEIGEAGAVEMAEMLARYSVSADEYAALVQKRTGRVPDVESPVVREISAEVNAKMSKEAIYAWMDLDVGAPLDIATLERDMQRIYGLGVFEIVDYSLYPVEDGAGLRISATQKSWGPNFLKFGLALQEVFDGESNVALGARFTMTQLNSLAAEWRNDLQIGTDAKVVSEFYQPLNFGSPYFIAAGALGSSTLLTIYEDLGDVAIGQVRFQDIGINLDLGKATHTLGEVRLGLQWGRSQRHLSVGDPNDVRLADVDTDIGELVLNIRHDSLDQVPFPRDGTLASFGVAASLEQLGATSEFQSYALNYLSAWSSGPYTVSLGLEMQTYQNLVAGSVVEPFALGGFLRLSGLNRNELTGNQLLLGKVILMRRLDAMSFGSVPLYFGSSLEVGNVWQNRDQVDFTEGLWSGSAFLAADTFLGPFYLGGGLTQGGNASFYLAIGQVF
ncbi:MAG: patatin-like phospholipase family protein [Gammaproteobacteria bacterium]|nr:patatin-like phospholipase family protein [Gammaproteobacteria bacterium]